MCWTALNGIWVQIPRPSFVLSWRADKGPLGLSTVSVNSSLDLTVESVVLSYMKGTE